jgi:hypothetical protein
MHPLQTYLNDLHDIRSTGAAVKETSYYPPLANLLNAVLLCTFCLFAHSQPLKRC